MAWFCAIDHVSSSIWILQRPKDLLHIKYSKWNNILPLFIQAFVCDTDTDILLSWVRLIGFVEIFEYKFDMAIIRTCGFCFRSFFCQMNSHWFCSIRPHHFSTVNAIFLWSLSFTLPPYFDVNVTFMNILCMRFCSSCTGAQLFDKHLLYFIIFNFTIIIN